MDKLQPILKHHFWILAFLVLPLGIWGYYSANSSLNAATAEREAALDGIYTNIRDGRSPNDEWDDEMKVIADSYEESVGIATSNLHETQESRMDWPTLMAASEPSNYRGEWPDALRYSYSNTHYEQLLHDVWKRYEPVVVDPESTEQVTWDEKVLINEEAILPVHVFSDPLNPTSGEIWDAQEDIWIHRLLAEAVVKTNVDADGIYTADLRSVELVELMGGDGTQVAAGGSSTGGSQSSGSSPSMPGGGDNQRMYNQGYGGARGGSRERSEQQIDTEFDPAEEIGSRGRESGGQSGARSRTQTQNGASGGDSDTVERYVRFNEADKARVRAFYMRVIVDQRKFPEFLVDLCNSEWPIQIVRFNVGPNPYYESAASPSQQRGRGGRGGYGGNPMGGGRNSPGAPGNMPATGGPGGGRFTGNPMEGGQQTDHEAYGALNSAELVQLDVLGLVTIFNPPAETESTATTASAAPADATAGDDAEATADSADVDAAAETQADDTAAADAAEEADAEAEGEPEPMDPEAPAVEEEASDPEAEAESESAVEADPADEAESSEEPAVEDDSAGTSEPAESSESGEAAPEDASAEEETPPETE